MKLGTSKGVAVKWWVKEINGKEYKIVLYSNRVCALFVLNGEEYVFVRREDDLRELLKYTEGGENNESKND